MKNTILRNNIVILTVILLPALMCAAQAGAVEYRNSYQQSAVSYQPSGFGIATTATAPTATFQSTSAYSDQWQEEEQVSMLNSDGSVNTGAYMGGGPRRAKKEEINNPGDPDEEEDEGNVPLGDALIPLALFACAYATYKVSRRRKEA